MFICSICQNCYVNDQSETKTHCTTSQVQVASQHHISLSHYEAISEKYKSMSLHYRLEKILNVKIGETVVWYSIQPSHLVTRF